MWSFPRSPAAHLAWLALALGCANYSQPAADKQQWSDSVRQGAGQAAELTADGARAAGKAVKVAVTGVRKGFDEPDPKAYGSFPAGYAGRIRHHMQHFGGVSPEASFQFGKPARGYLNAGLLAGGGVRWQGYLVEVRVEQEALFASQARPQRFVVRMREGEVVEVIEAEYADGLRWADAQRQGRPGEGVAANQD